MYKYEVYHQHDHHEMNLKPCYGINHFHLQNHEVLIPKILHYLIFYIAVLELFH